MSHGIDGVECNEVVLKCSGRRLASPTSRDKGLHHSLPQSVVILMMLTGHAHARAGAASALPGICCCSSICYLCTRVQQFDALKMLFFNLQFATCGYHGCTAAAVAQHAVECSSAASAIMTSVPLLYNINCFNSSIKCLKPTPWL